MTQAGRLDVTATYHRAARCHAAGRERDRWTEWTVEREGDREREGEGGGTERERERERDGKIKVQRTDGGSSRGGHVYCAVTGLRDTTLWASTSTTGAERGEPACSVSSVLSLQPAAAASATQEPAAVVVVVVDAAAVQVIVYFGVGCIAERLKAYECALSLARACVCVCVYLSSTRVHLSSVGNSAVGGWRSGWGQGAAV